MEIADVSYCALHYEIVAEGEAPQVVLVLLYHVCRAQVMRPPYKFGYEKASLQVCYEVLCRLVKSAITAPYFFDLAPPLSAAAFAPDTQFFHSELEVSISSFSLSAATMPAS